MHHFPSVFEVINDLSIEQIEGLLILSSKLKNRQLETNFFANSVPFIANVFLENSTRTKNSFAIAITKLGCRYLDFNAQTSSLKKGESLKETLRTLSCQGIDLCIIRSSTSNILKELKLNPPMKLINGGDGLNEHPTQALLDLFTMKELSLPLDCKKIAIIGDSLHSRVAHSLCQLLPLFGCSVVLIGPPEFLPNSPPNESVTLSNNLEKEMPSIDYIYTLRIQKERHQGQGLDTEKNYHELFGMSMSKLKKHQKFIPVFHPGPANIGVEIQQDIIDSTYYMGYEQVKNSIYMRMAIIITMLQNNDKSVGQFHETILPS